MVQQVQAELRSKAPKLTQRPAAANPSSCVDASFQNDRGSPFNYQQGVIYTDCKRGTYRVYRVRGDRIDLKYNWGKDEKNKEEAWKKAIKAIDEAAV